MDSPVVALSVKQGLGIAVQGLYGVCGVVALLRVIQSHNESSLLYGIQRLLVLPTAEVFCACVCPGHSGDMRWGV